MTRIYICGDTHGARDLGKLQRLCAREKLTYEDYVIICGDCGILWNEEIDTETKRTFEQLNTNILFVDGNHENHAALNALPPDIWNGGMVHRLSEHILHLMRGQIFTIEGLKFFCLGGADSHDKEYRIPNLSWWKEESISARDIETAIQSLDKANFQVDYIITHIPPNRFIDKIIKELTRCGEEIPYYLREKFTRTPSGDMLERIAPKIKFKKWFSGHLHTDMRIAKFYSLYEHIVRIK